MLRLSQGEEMTVGKCGVDLCFAQVDLYRLLFFCYATVVAPPVGCNDMLCEVMLCHVHFPKCLPIFPPSHWHELAGTS